MQKLCFDPTACSPPHSKIIYPNQIDSDTDFRHTITSTYDARTLVLFNSKIIHPKQSDSNTSSSIQQAHFYHLRQGVTYPKQWVQQRLLADSLMRDKLHKKYRECQALWSSGKMGKTHNITTPLQTLTMCRYITLKIHTTRNDI